MNVLSVADGISCGQIALERSEIEYNNYYASEIDKYAKAVTQFHHPNTIQLGDMTKWKEWNLPQINLLMGGTPCQGFSSAGKGLNFNDPRSKLFFDFVDILKYYKPQWFLFENVKMKREWQDIITEYLGIKPIMIDSALVSAQSRKRLYWTNIPNVTQPKDKNIFLKNIIENGEVDREKSYCIDANYYKGGSVEQYKKKKRRQIVNLPIYQSEKRLMVKTIGHGYIEESIDKKDKYPSLYAQSPASKHLIQTKDSVTYRKLTPIECERLQTIEDNWTLIPHPVYKNRMMSNTQRYKMLGNAWTVDVIAHIFSFLPKERK